MKYKLFALLALIPLSVFAVDLSKKVTIITTCNPCPTYPRTIYLQISQFGMYKHLPQFFSIPKIIVCDGLRNPADKDAYDGYKENLRKLVANNPQFQNTTLVFCEEWKCLVGAVKEAMEHVETEYVYLHQDDFDLTLPVDLEGLINAMDLNHNIKMVRLNQSQNPAGFGLGRGTESYVDDYVLGGSEFPLLRTSIWSDNDHIARSDYYRDFIFPIFGDEKTYMEARLMHLGLLAYQQDPEEYSRIYGAYLYGTYNEGPFLFHLDRKSTCW